MRPSRRAMARCLAAAVLLASAHAGAQAPLGRLFFTPEERAALDAGRPLHAEPEVQTDITPRRLDGIVRRSDGHSTVWINGAAEQRRLGSAERAPVQDAEGRWQSLRVGEAADDATPAPDIRIRRHRK